MIKNILTTMSVAVVATCAMNASALNIVLTNDDGYETENIQALYSALTNAGHDVIMSAPKGAQSGTSGMIEFLAPVEVGETNGQYYVDSTPAASVLYGIDVLAMNKWGAFPDLVLSGPNEGNNIGLVTPHSGTIGAAVAAINKGIPTIALSAEGADEYAAEVVAELTVQLVASLDEGRGPLLPPNTGLNVNMPAIAEGQTTDDFSFEMTKIGTAAPFGLQFSDDLSMDPVVYYYLVIEGGMPEDYFFQVYGGKAGVAIASPYTMGGYPEDRNKSSEGNVFEDGDKVTVSVIEGTYQADSRKEALVKGKLMKMSKGKKHCRR
ncbi:5'/3'-nucleotidase SurE [Pontiellaceae bacterium B1224]|nr:5'/3'-nucleotidase SurE [Pontiellaceae bacterium B1224]